MVFCSVVLWLDVATSADFNECFLLPIAVAAAYPIRRDWATWLIVAVAVATVVLGAVLEPEGESLNAMLTNRGVTVVVILVIGLLMSRVTSSERQLFRIATTDPLTGILNRRHFLEQLGRERLRAMRYGTAV
ncbi:MAG TPA: GGDEF domain-containing protein, partial [Candidatus Sulfotelmatobacter sp.]|nr:GGDEF domain-containing protein [Candidatus Sulfotelmatobacter sp.]